MKPIKLISESAAITLRIVMMGQYDNAREFHGVDRDQIYRQLDHLCNELGIEIGR